MPEGEKLGRNGFRRVSTADARRFGLPSPGRAAVFQPEPIPAEPAILAPPRDRTIPQATKSAVWQRDGANCGICGTTQGPWHIDHIFPFSKGGSNTVENLRILCAACNLRKGSAVEGSDPVVPATPELVDAARALGAAVPSDVHELGDILGRLVEDGLHNQALGVAWALDAHPDTSGELIDAIVEALRPVDGDEARLFELLQSDNPGPDRLLEFARSDDPEVAGRAAAEASRVLDGNGTRRFRDRFRPVPTGSDRRSDGRPQEIGPPGALGLDSDLRWVECDARDVPDGNTWTERRRVQP